MLRHPEVNNAIYETLGHLWWSDEAGFELTSLRYCVNPVRYAYFRRVLDEVPVPGREVLDIGCGGGYLAEAFARDGFRVTGLDPAVNSITAARRHAEASRLPIRYEVGRGEALPFPDSAFDIVCCCDVLEHVDHVGDVVREAARTLKPAGVFLYDTVNRTRRSKLLLIKVWQDWNLGGFAQPNAHVWDKFIRPADLSELLRSAGLIPHGERGIATVRSPAALLHTLWQIRTRRLSGPALANAFALRETSDLSVSYMGSSSKPSRPPQTGAVQGSHSYQSL